jgi:hypothetical protein
MKSQSKPFVVEVKHSRAVRDKPRSIWGEIDLAEVTRKVEEDRDDKQTLNAPSLAKDR